MFRVESGTAKRVPFKTQETGISELEIGEMDGTECVKEAR